MHEPPLVIKPGLENVLENPINGGLSGKTQLPHCRMFQQAMELITRWLAGKLWNRSPWEKHLHS